MASKRQAVCHVRFRISFHHPRLRLHLCLAPGDHPSLRIPKIRFPWAVLLVRQSPGSRLSECSCRGTENSRMPPGHGRFERRCNQVRAVIGYLHGVLSIAGPGHEHALRRHRPNAHALSDGGVRSETGRPDGHAEQEERTAWDFRLFCRPDGYCEMPRRGRPGAV